MSVIDLTSTAHGRTTASATSASPILAAEATGDDTYVSTARAACASGVVAALERMWNEAIKAQVPDLPNVVIVLASGTIGMRPGTIRLGHFARERWTVGETRLPEMFVSGEGLARGAVDVLGTLLHEAAHAVAAVRGIQDTSRQGRWHNARFKAVAEELGLQIRQAPGIGWSDTAVPSPTQDLYREALADLDAAITIWRRTEQDVMTGSATGPDGSAADDGDQDGDDEAVAAPKSGSVAAICGCERPRRIRLAASVLELGEITCGLVWCRLPRLLTGPDNHSHTFLTGVRDDRAEPHRAGPSDDGRLDPRRRVRGVRRAARRGP